MRTTALLFPMLAAVAAATSAAVNAAGAAEVESRILAIETTDRSMWIPAYSRLLQDVTKPSATGVSAVPGGREAGEVALRLLDVVLAGTDRGTVDLAETVRAIPVPELRAAGFVALARDTGTTEWLHAALDALAGEAGATPAGQNMTAAVADAALSLGDRAMAEAAMANLAPGQVRASVASRLARARGIDPAAFADWAEEVERLAEGGDLRAAVDLAIAADAREAHKRRDGLLRDLATEVLDLGDLPTALRAAEAIYAPRMHGLAVRDMVKDLLAAGRSDDAVRIARGVREPKSASAIWLALAEPDMPEADRRERLEWAYDHARRVPEALSRDDYTADVLKRAAERGWYDAALSRISCIGSDAQRDRVVEAAEKRAKSPGGYRGADALSLADCAVAPAAPVPSVRTVSPRRGIVDASARRAALRRAGDAAGAAFCDAADVEIDPDMEVLDGLRGTSGYGSDQRAESFSWTVMVLAGRHLAGHAASGDALAKLMVRWAEARALEATEVSHDAYYALKRLLLPTIVAFTLLDGRMAADDAAKVGRWLDGLVRRIDHRFDGEVDRNNHRYLADSVQMVWGSWIGDAELFNRGIAALDMARRDIRPDGSLPLEVRRGARALWYMRQSASSFTVMSAALRAQGFAELARMYEEALLLPVMSFIVDGARYPTHLLPYVAENYIAGPSQDYFVQDAGYLDRRGHGRHYMAWVERAAGTFPEAAGAARMRLLAEREVLPERPLIDEFAAGNATCFWASTATNLQGVGR